MSEQSKVDSYIQTVERLEPDIHPIDASAYYASAAISLKRIADFCDLMQGLVQEALKGREDGK